MKITYSSSKYTSADPKAPGWFRHLVLAWFLAAAVEYLLLPDGLRTLTGLSGLAEMSLMRLLLALQAVLNSLKSVQLML